MVGGFHNANRFFHGLPDRRLFGPVRTTEGSGGYSAGHLIFKPHFVLIAARQWQILANAIVAATALVVASLLAFGSETWIGFYRSLIDTSSVNLIGGNMGWPTIESFLGVVRSIGGGAELAWTCRAVVAAATALEVCWHGRRDDICYSLKASALSLGTFVVTPYAVVMIWWGSRYRLPFWCAARWNRGSCAASGRRWLVY